MPIERIKRLTGGHPVIVGISLLALLAAPVLMIGLWPDHAADFRSAAERIQQNRLPGELIVLHPPGNAWFAKHFQDFPTVAPLKLSARDVRGAPGVWFVTPDPARVKRVFRKAIKPFRKRGKVSFGELTVLHYWARKGGR